MLALFVFFACSFLFNFVNNLAQGGQETKETLHPGSNESNGYDGHKAVEYAQRYWNHVNHDCKKGYLTCSPWAYFGGEHCGYPSHGGDCANFVSQCLIHGGHAHLNQGGPCSGYPCHREVVAANSLAECLQQHHNWGRHCGKREPPPHGHVKKGDVLVFHRGSCHSFEAHATIIVHVAGGIRIAAHSNQHFNVSYKIYESEFDYYDWLIKK